MHNLYLRAKDEETLKSALHFLCKRDDFILNDIDYSLDIIGPLYKGHEEHKAIEGFHANIRCSSEIYIMIPQDIIMSDEPQKPVRQWL